MSKIQYVINSAIFSLIIFSCMPVFAADEDEVDAVVSCLKAWGQHPFGKQPKYKTLTSSVKVFGIGDNSKDAEITNAPALVVVDPGVNVMGGATVELLNPNGWYCLKSQVNVMGGLTIKAHCKAHLASALSGVTVLGSANSNNSVTVMGSTEVELVGCK